MLEIVDATIKKGKVNQIHILSKGCGKSGVCTILTEWVEKYG
jgi:hypothetical protein